MAQDDNEDLTLRDPRTQTSNDVAYRQQAGPYFQASRGTVGNKLDNFARFTPRQALALFLAKNELFKKIVDVHGAIVECGVFMGGGLFTWAQLSAIYEPYNHNRRVLGFDTFDGFPEISDKDKAENPDQELHHKSAGGYRFDGYQELQDGLALFNLNRPIGHVPRADLIRGDATETILEYLERNPHLVVACLYLDFDLYEPTAAALKAFLPRMPRGAVLAFDELNQSQWPGETLAVLDEVGLSNLAIRRFPFTPALSYAVLGE